MAETEVLRFDRFELQPSERLLLRDGQPVPLRAKAFDLLMALVGRAGQLVTKDELLDQVWPGLVVEENNVATQVATLRKALHSELIVTIPGRGYRFAALPRPPTADAAVSPLPPRPPATAPAAPPLIGREADLAGLREALERPGCVTLVGPGGVGKTTLARAVVAQAHAPSTWVDLADLEDAQQLLPALARAAGATHDAANPWPALEGALGAAQMLLLDNAEHLVAEVAAVAQHLQAALPALRVLVTSQLPLAIPGERVLRLGPLDLPAAGMGDAAALQTGAVALFLSRVRDADSRWQMPASGPGVLRELCTRLDGLPLALEMAAARVPALGLQQVWRAVSEGAMPVLGHRQRAVPERHRTLQALLDWSHGLLDAEEQRMYRSLGVFAGGFTLDLAVAVSTSADAEIHERWDAVDRLAALVDRSLVWHDHGDPPRYRLLETMRADALARLRAADGEEPVARARHAAALEALFHESHDQSGGPVGGAARRRALVEMENAREARAWAMAHDPALAVRLATYVAAHASYSPWRQEVFNWLTACEPLLATVPVDPASQALYWRHFACQTLNFSAPERAAAHAQKAITLSRETGDEHNLAMSLLFLSVSTEEASDAQQAALDEAVALSDQHPEWPSVRPLMMNAQAHARDIRGDLPGAAEFLREGLVQAREAGAEVAARTTALHLAAILRLLGEHAQALHFVDEALAESPELEDVFAARMHLLRVSQLFELGRFGEAIRAAPGLMRMCRRYSLHVAVGVLALGLAQAGRLPAAAMVIGHLREVHARHGTFFRNGPQDDVPRAMTLLLQGLDGPEFERLAERGRRLDAAGLDRLLEEQIS